MERSQSHHGFGQLRRHSKDFGGIWALAGSSEDSSDEVMGSPTLVPLTEDVFGARKGNAVCPLSKLQLHSQVRGTPCHKMYHLLMGPPVMLRGSTRSGMKMGSTTLLTGWGA